MKLPVPKFSLAVFALILSACTTQRPLVPPGAEAIVPSYRSDGGRETRSAMSNAQVGVLFGAKSCASTDDLGKCMAEALKVANDLAKSQTAEEQALTRNRVQDYLIAASNEQCRIYKGTLRTASAEPNFWMGSGTTLFSAAGAAAKSVDGAKILSGVAAIFSGVRAEFNQDFFASLTADVIIGAINSARADKLTEIATVKGDGANATLIKYTIERAVADAIEYHARCSIAAGLTHASKALKEYDDIGQLRLDEINRKREALVQSRKALGTAANSFTAWFVAQRGALEKAEADFEEARDDALKRYAAKSKDKRAPDCATEVGKKAAPCDTIATADEPLQSGRSALFAISNSGFDNSAATSELQAKLKAASDAEVHLAQAKSDDDRILKSAVLQETMAALATKQTSVESMLRTSIKKIKVISSKLATLRP